MFTDAEKAKVRRCYDAAWKKITEEHVACFKDMDKPLFLISNNYPGVWMEHVYDAVMYARLCPQGLEIAKNTVNLFLDYQTEAGQFPCYVWNANVIGAEKNVIGYSHIQEVVSFAKLALIVCKMSGDRQLLEKTYLGCIAWDSWLKKYRMTRGKGLVEMFCGYDTGHDESARLEGMSCPGNYTKDGVKQNAGVLPEGDNVVPVFACDMNANFYGSKVALSEMAQMLGKADEAEKWQAEAEEVKAKLFEICYDEDDMFFYDVDKHDNKRKCKSCTVFHMFMEGVLKPGEELTEQIYNKHIKNPEEFWTPYPFPSMAVNDPAWRKVTQKNCWGYFTQTLIVLRTSLWMDKYGKTEDHLHVLKQFIKAWTNCYDKIKFGQELDPITGEPSDCAEYYSSSMLSYIYAARRLGIVDEAILQI